MPGRQRKPDQGAPQAPNHDSTDTSSTTSTGGGPSSGAAGPATAGGGGNSLMADFVDRHRDHIARDMGIDLDMFLEVDPSEARAAIPLVIADAQAAVQGQMDNDLGAWDSGVAGIPMDAEDIERVDHKALNWDTLHFSQSVADDPAYPQLSKQFEEVKTLASGARNATAALLTPTMLKGRYIPDLPSLGYAWSGFQEIEDKARATYEPLYRAAFELYYSAMDAQEDGGYALESRVLSLATGPLSSFPVGSPHFNYLWVAFESASPSAAVKVKVAELMGVAGTPVAPFAALSSWWEMWRKDRPDAAAPADGKPAAEEAAPAAGPDAEHTAMAGKHGKGPSTREFDTSSAKPEAKPSEEEEEEEKKEAKKEPVDETAKYGGSATVKTGDGKLDASLEGTRSRQKAGGGSSETKGTLEGGVNADRVYGQGGVSHTSSQRDSEDENAPGMDVTTGVKGGTDENGNLTGTASVGAKVKHADGSETGVNKSVGVKDGKVEVGMGGSRTTPIEGSTDKRERSVNGTVNSDGEVSIQAGSQVKNKDGEVQKGVSGGGTLDMNGSDGKKGASGNVSVQRGKVNVVANASWQQTLQPPVEEGGRWVVEFETAFNAGGGLSAKGKKGGAGASMGYERRNGGKRYFKTKDEADRFWKEGEIPSAPESSEDARKMAEGDTRTKGSGMNASANVEASYGMFSIGAGGSVGNEDFENTTKGKGGLIRVEAGGRAFAAWNASVGLAGVSGGYGQSSSTMESKTVEFDLDTKMGREAYDYYLQKEELPPSGRGWRTVGTAKGESEQEIKKLNILGVAYGRTHTVSHVERTEDGHRFEEDQGTEATSLSIPLLGSYNESHSLWMQQVDDETAVYQTESVVKASDVDDVRKGMHDGSGDYQGSSGKGSNKGTYRIQAAIPEPKMIGFINRVTGPDYERIKYTIGWRAADYADGLRKRLIASRGDYDQQRRALAQWVADGGEEAIQFLYKVLDGARNTDLYVAIDGDEYMKGMKGHLDQELRLTRWQQRVDGGEGGYAIANEMRTDLVYQQNRRLALKNYGELPGRLLASEYERTDAHIANLQLLMNRAIAAVGEDAPEGSVAQVESGQYQAAMKLHHRSRGMYYDARRRVTFNRRIHLDGYGRGLGPDDSAYEEYTSERSKYKDAEKIYNDGLAIEERAKTWEMMANAVDLGVNNAGMLASLLTKAAFEFQTAARKLDAASEIYGEIHSRRGGSLLEGYKYGYSYVEGM